MGRSSLGCGTGKEGLHLKGLGFKTGARSVLADTSAHRVGVFRWACDPWGHWEPMSR